MAEGPDEAVMSEIGGDLESFLKETREGANEVFRRNFSSLDVNGADFFGTELKESAFSGCRFQGCDFTKASFDCFSFPNSSVPECVFERTDFPASSFLKRR